VLEFLTGAGLKIAETVLGWIAPPIRDAILRVRARNLIRESSGRKISILLACLDGDNASKSYRETLRETIRREFSDAVEITLWPEPLIIADGHEYDAERGAYATAQKWLARTHCDFLIWGREKGRNERGETVLSLRFTVADIDSRSAESYKLTDTLDLPSQFIAHFGAAIAARVLTGVAPIFDQPGRYLVPLMRVQAERLALLVAKLHQHYDADTRGALLHSYALVRAAIGEQAGSNDDLQQAVVAYGEALKERTRERVPLDWATTQNNLGNALASLGERESGTARLEQAVVAYGEALKERTRERVPLDWAATQNNLGTALKTLGERENGTARLEQAVVAYGEALKELTRERVPLQWAATQNNLGNALASLGERESGTARLEQAVVAYGEALKERTSARVPLDWAMTQNNLGNALKTLGERESGTARLDEAVAAFKAALDVFEPAGATHYVEVARGDLAQAEAVLAQRRKA
jgi:tetratricopeptide (TPR) repeat protein